MCQSTIVSFGNFEYATLDFARADDSTSGSQHDFKELPRGWEIAPGSLPADAIEHVIGGYNWGTLVLCLSDGSGIWTRGNPHSVNRIYQTADASKLEHRSPNSYKPTQGSWRILIRRPGHVGQTPEDYMQSLGNRLWETRDFMDCVLACSGREIPCHRHILAAASCVFSRMLLSGMREATEHRIEVGDAMPAAVEAMAKFVYTGTLDVENPVALEVLKLADRYDIQPLASVCVQKLLDNVTAENVVDLVRAARPFSEKESFVVLWEKICSVVEQDATFVRLLMREL